MITTLVFGSLFVAQQNWVAVGAEVLCLAATVLFARWFRSQSFQKTVISHPERAARGKPTKPELAGYVGMIALYLSAFNATAITGDWMWAGIGLLSLLLGLWLLARSLKQREPVSARSMLDHFL